MPIAVVVADSQPHACLLLAILTVAHTAHSTFLAKCSVVVVHEQQAGARVAGNIDVGPAIVVEIRGNRSQAVVDARA